MIFVFLIIFIFFSKARKFARAMKAPLVYCSAADSTNIQKIFKICLSKVFDLNCTLEQNVDSSAGPVLEY